MTRREAAIVSAYTGYLIGGLGDLYNYLSELIGRPIYTHEIPVVLDEYHSKIKQDFVMLEVKDELKAENKPEVKDYWQGLLSEGEEYDV